MSGQLCRIGVIALVVMAASQAHAEKARAKGSQDAAEMWIRYLGPASDAGKVRAGTADTLYAAIFDNDNDGKSCSGTFGKDKMSDEIDCLGHHFALLEFDFEPWQDKYLKTLPAELAGERAKIKETGKTALLVMHRYEEMGIKEVVIIALVKGRGGKSLVSAVWKAESHSDGER